MCDEKEGKTVQSKWERSYSLHSVGSPTKTMEKHKVTQEYTRVDSGGASNIKVTIRARPPEDKGANTGFVEITQSEQEDAGARILIKNPDGTGSKKHAEVAYTFDNIFEQSVSQDKVFTDTCKFQIDHVMEGYNCCCFACKYIYI